MSEAERKKEREVTLREKRQAVELCLAFAVSVKHCEWRAGAQVDINLRLILCAHRKDLRGEDGV